MGISLSHSEGNDDVVESNDPEVINGDEDGVETSTDSPKTEESREDRLARLRATLEEKGEVEAEDDPEEDEEPEDDDTVEDPEDPPAEDEQPADANEDDPEPTETPEPEAEKELGIAEVEGAKLSAKVWRELPQEARRAYNVLRDEVAKTRHELSVRDNELDANKRFADYGKQLDDFAKAKNLSAAGMQEGLAALGLINQGDPSVVPWLLDMAERIGGPDAVPRAAPAKPPALVKAEKLRDEGVLTDEEFNELAAAMPQETPAPQRRAAPAQRQPPATLEDAGIPSMTAAATQQDAQQSEYQARVDTANTALDKRENEYRERYGAEWDRTLRAKVQDELNRFTGVPPEKWVALLDQSVRVVVATNRKNIKPRTTKSDIGGGSAPKKRGKSVDDLRGKDRVRRLASQNLL